MTHALRLHAKCQAIGDDAIHVAVTTDNDLWLANESGSPVNMKCCELFGFGVGAFVPKPTGLWLL